MVPRRTEHEGQTVHRLEREKMAANHKRIYRLYTEEGLKVRRKRKKLRSQVRTAPMLVPSRVNER